MDDHHIPLPNLPQEIIIEILLWLPANSLLRFRCVSKLWYSIISSPQFIKTHLKSSSSHTSKYLHNHKLILNFQSSRALLAFPLPTLLSQKSTLNTAEEVPNPTQAQFQILGSCNGVICLSLYPGKLILWNPSVRKFKQLPSSVKEMSFARDVMYGLGYIESSDDYKVVEIKNVSFGGHRGLLFMSPENRRHQVKVYSLRINSWTRIQDFPGALIPKDSGTYLNGAIHWPVARCDLPAVPRFIISLNLVSEVYEDVPLPPFEPKNMRWSLMTSGGNLCVFCLNQFEMDVWVMREYGVKESWMKMVSIPRSVNPWRGVSSLCVTENGDVLMNNDSRLILYNSKKDEFEYPEIGSPGSVKLEAATYVESLVSPKI